MLNNEFIDVYRYTFPESTKFTRFGTRKDPNTNIIHVSASRIDYFFCSKDLINKVEDIYIEEEDVFNSDHRPITILIKSKAIPLYFTEEPFITRIDIGNNNKWKTSFKPCVTNLIQNSFPNPISNVTTQQDIEIHTKKITKVINTAIETTFPSKIIFPKERLDTAVPGYHDPKVTSLRHYKRIAIGAMKYLTNNINNDNIPITNELVEAINTLNAEVCLENYFIEITNPPAQILSNLTETAKHLDNKIHRVLTKIKRDNIKASVSNKLKKIENEPDKLFSLFRPPKRKKIEFVSKITDNNIKLLFKDDMVKEVEQN